MSTINVEAVHFSVDKKLSEFIEGRVQKLQQFFDNIVHVDVTLKVDKKESHDNKIVEIKVQVPGKDLFAKKQSNTFEASTDEAFEALKRQVDKHKGKF
jgi:putative sigma-54 modulation protein